MVWPIVIAAGSAVISGVMSSNQARANAASAQQATQANAWATQNQARINNQANTAISMFNAAMSMKSAQINSEAATLLASYNSSLLAQTNEYNQLLLEDELTQIFENEGLALEYLEQERSRVTGETVAQQASSGTTIGFGSNQDVEVDILSQHEIQVAVLNQQTDRQAASVRNAMARGSWETDMAIQKLQYETRLGNQVSMQNAYLNAAGTLMTNSVNSWATTQSANNSAYSIRSGGQATANAYRAQASTAMASGIVNGISSAAGSYAQSYSPKSTVPPSGQNSQSVRIRPIAVGGQSETGSLLA